MTPAIFNALPKTEQELFIRWHDTTPQAMVNVLVRKEMKIAYTYAPGYTAISAATAQEISEDEYEAMRFGFDFAIHCLDTLTDMQADVAELNRQN